VTSFWRDRLVVRAIAVFAAARAVGAACIAFAAWRWDATFARAFKVWDGYWYLHIVDHGYPASIARPAPFTAGGVAFFPGFPALTRALMRVTGLPSAIAAAVVVFAAGLVAVVALALLVRQLYDERVALRAVALFCFFPGAYTLSLLYSEGLMVTAVIVCFLALYNRRWVVAGLAGALASFSRPTGVAIVVACAWETVRAVRTRRDWASLWATFLVPLGAAAYLVYLWRHTGEIGVYFRVQREAWFDELSIGSGLWDTVVHLFDGNGLSQRLILFAGLVFIAGAGVVLARSRLPVSMKLYVPAVLVLPVLLASVGARPRYVFVAFPLLIALAAHLPRRAYVALLSVSAVALVLLLVTYVERSPEIQPFLYPINPSP